MWYREVTGQWRLAWPYGLVRQFDKYKYSREIVAGPQYEQQDVSYSGVYSLKSV